MRTRVEILVNEDQVESMNGTTGSVEQPEFRPYVRGASSGKARRAITVAYVAYLKEVER